ncbi:MAG: hypothetical protein CMJ81_02455 [Planctomycetaceae bacterium]|nr:hypothetical protein [Planctomycetaceae bacterium]MBP61619.1 hypothetical protein [Planctomycetaceae bacterium]
MFRPADVMSLVLSSGESILSVVKYQAVIQENPSREWRQESVKTERCAVAFGASVKERLQVRMRQVSLVPR